MFSPRRAGALAGVGGDQIGQWARYGLIHPTVYEGRPANLYAFYDVAEAIVVHWLRERNFPYPEIHAAIERARQEYTDWPLLTAPLGVAQQTLEDRGAIVQKIGDSYVETGHPGEQVVLRPHLLDQARDMLAAGGWFADQLGLKRIEVDPQKLGGAPSLRGRRWPVERVARIAADAPGRRILTEDYELELEDIEESVRWTEAVAQL